MSLTIGKSLREIDNGISYTSTFTGYRFNYINKSCTVAGKVLADIKDLSDVIACEAITRCERGGGQVPFLWNI